jgi:hypothetical protein
MSVEYKLQKSKEKIKRKNQKKLQKKIKCFELYAIFLFLWCFSLYMTSFYSELLLTGVMFTKWFCSGSPNGLCIPSMLTGVMFTKWFCSGSPNGLCIPSMHV